MLRNPFRRTSRGARQRAAAASQCKAAFRGIEILARQSLPVAPCKKYLEKRYTVEMNHQARNNTRTSGRAYTTTVLSQRAEPT